MVYLLQNNCRNQPDLLFCKVNLHCSRQSKWTVYSLIHFILVEKRVEESGYLYRVIKCNSYIIMLWDLACYNQMFSGAPVPLEQACFSTCSFSIDVFSLRAEQSQ
ncbi:Hypothetical predicted protein [Podarcis lilfordi]|nr:Hypothetical predicted protein [Podarcis lilfordi]